ncbi:MAG: DinB family protein [Weeksellaceae bacterium]
MIAEEQFKIQSLTRQKLLAYLDHLSPEELSDIPYGFKNNIWWNIVHVVVTQQLLCYYLTGNEMTIDKEWVENFKKGTAPNPDEVPTHEEIEEIKRLLITTQQELELDYKQGIFTSYEDYPTSYGFVIKSIEDAILYNNIHEALHLGTVMAIKKLV